MPKYIYSCPSCLLEYTEVRLPMQEQHVTNCDVCSIEFTLVGEE